MWSSETDDAQPGDASPGDPEPLATAQPDAKPSSRKGPDVGTALMYVGIGWVALAGPFMLEAQVGWLANLGIEQGDRPGALLVMFGLFGFALPAMLVVLFRHERGDQLVRLSRSVPLQAVVESIEVDGVKGEPAYSEKPVLRYVDSRGTKHTVTAQWRVTGLSAGDGVDARYDPEHPAWVVVDHPDAFARRTVRRLVIGMSAINVLVIAFGIAHMAG